MTRLLNPPRSNIILRTAVSLRCLLRTLQTDAKNKHVVFISMTNKLNGCTKPQTISMISINRFCTTSDNKVKVLYDGDCPLCMKEIKLLMWKDKDANKIEFVDITDKQYDPDKYNGINYNTAMDKMHVIDEQGQVHVGVGAMREMYKAVGWGWMWTFSKYPRLGPITDRCYDWFAKNRMWITGRGNTCEKGHCKTNEKR